MKPRTAWIARTRLILLCFGLAAVLAPNGPAQAQDASPSPMTDPIQDGLVSADAVASVAKSLNCPLCQGYNLQDCPLTVCAQMRAQIARDLAAGSSPEAIQAAFVADYGPDVLNAPPTEGFYWLVWLAPFLALLVAALGLLRSGHRLSKAGGTARRTVSPDAVAGSEDGERHRSLVDRFSAMADDPDRSRR